jgi:hypothetical protein
MSRPVVSEPTVDERKTTYTVVPPQKIADLPKISLSAPQKNAVPSPVTATKEQASLNHIAVEEVQKEWDKIVDDVRRKKISVGTILGESVPVSITDQTLQIACFDDFHFSSLKRNQMFLTETINTLLGSKLRIEPVLRPSVASPALLPAKTVPRKPNEAPDVRADGSTPPKEHPLIETLYRDFGAERI